MSNHAEKESLNLSLQPLPLRFRQTPQIDVNWTQNLHYVSKSSFPLEIIIDLPEPADIRSLYLLVATPIIPTKITLFGSLPDSISYFALGDVGFKNDLNDLYRTKQKQHVNLKGIISSSIKLLIPGVYNDAQVVMKEKFDICITAYGISGENLKSSQNDAILKNEKYKYSSTKHANKPPTNGKDPSNPNTFTSVSSKVDKILENLGIPVSGAVAAPVRTEKVQSKLYPSNGQNAPRASVFTALSTPDDSDILVSDLLESIENFGSRIYHRMSATQKRGLFAETEYLDKKLQYMARMESSVKAAKERLLCARMVSNWPEASALRDQILTLRLEFSDFYKDIQLSDLHNMLMKTPPMLPDSKNPNISISTANEVQVSSELPFSGFRTKYDLNPLLMDPKQNQRNPFDLVPMKPLKDINSSSKLLPNSSQLVPVDSFDLPISFVPKNLPDSVSSFESLSHELHNLHVPIEALSMAAPDFDHVNSPEEGWDLRRALPVRELLGTPLLLSLYNPDQSLRIKAVEHLNYLLESFVKRAGMNEEEMNSDMFLQLVFRVYIYILATLLQDPVKKVYLTSLSLLHFLLLSISGNIPPVELRNFLTPCMLAVLEKASYQDIETRESSIAFITSITAVPKLGYEWVSAYVLADQEDISHLSWRFILVRLYLIQQIIGCYGIKKEDKSPLSIENLMGWCSLCLMHDDSYVRNAAMALVWTLERFNPILVEPLLQKLLPSAMNRLADSEDYEKFLQNQAIAEQYIQPCDYNPEFEAKKLQGGTDDAGQHQSQISFKNEDKKKESPVRSASTDSKKEELDKMQKKLNKFAISSQISNDPTARASPQNNTILWSM